MLFFCRDPNFEGTLSAFEDSIQWALKGKFTDQDIEEAKLSVFAEVSIRYDFTSRAFAETFVTYLSSWSVQADQSENQLQ